MKRNILLHLLIIPFLILSCGGNKSAKEDKEGDSLLFKYAKNISIVKYSDGYYVVKLADPWTRGKILHTYILQKKGTKTNTNIKGSTIVNIPLRKALVSTSVHCELVKDISREDCISGVCDAQYIKSEWIQKKLKSGKIADCGNSISPNIEKIIEISPDAILLSPMQNTGGYGKVENLGIPIIELADYMEPTALGRAEWIKFYALLFGGLDEGLHFFDKMQESYLSLKEKASETKTRPTIIMDKQVNGIWYLPGGKSTISQILSDAGTKYVYAQDKSVGSIQKSFESILDSNGNSDIWLMRYFKTGDKPMSLKELATENKGYTMFKAYRRSMVYGCNTATYSFFEDTPFRPDLLLKDIIIIAHPEIKGLGETRYFKKLK
ncbi:ABC transporter substrate-binding protein [uncultured Prevotella sp.]|uniref:ABC transporter substrate-binding protein n=1 Tax=uncultured Prevotella sp. TaxID=159272 RepID=UPI002630BCC7|nr:ABC transporter substrate-binding protein [uncultured Prevotella sp.]